MTKEEIMKMTYSISLLPASFAPAPSMKTVSVAYPPFGCDGPKASPTKMTFGGSGLTPSSAVVRFTALL